MFWRNKGSKLLKNLETYRSLKDRNDPISMLRRQICKFKHIVWTFLTASDIDRNADISASVRLPHPTGVVIHAEAVIGENCMIMQQVTIGIIRNDEAPVLERDVYVGAGAKILGPVTIGAGARIGANAVVLEDVPAGCTAVGVPARIIDRSV